MRKIIRKYERWLMNNDRVIVEILKVDNPKFKDGIIYTFRCMDEDGQIIFAIENSHGQPHIHLRTKKVNVDYDWKTAYLKFENMVDEREKKIKEGKIW
jgi:hypothetical protein